MNFIVECSICQQPWEVDEQMYSGAGVWIQLPEHTMLDRSPRER